MRCSDCSEVVKPVVICDIDGTLGDYQGHFLRFASLYTGSSVPDTYDGSVPFKQWYLHMLPSETEATWHAVKLAYRQGAQKRSMPIYPAAAEFCRDVREDGAELWLATTRPYLRLDNIDPDTRHWLSLHNIEFDGLLFDDRKYDVMAERVDKERVVAVVDDLSEQIESARRVFGGSIPILRRTKYNGWSESGPEMRDNYYLKTIRDTVRSRIRYWKDNT